MKFKIRIYIASVIIAASLFLLTGCSLNGVQTASKDQIKLPFGVLSDITLPRQHWEETDPQDGLFYTYWEMNYGSGSAAMKLVNNGFNLTWSDYSGNDIVTGKGIKPCYGETFSWTTDKNTGADYFGVYGWLKDPLVEYYIGRGGGNKEFGPYTVDGKEYTLWIDETPERANILNPLDDPSLPRKFLQFNCEGLGGSSINMAKHYKEWEKLLKNYTPPSGWEWHNIITPDYCVVGVEVFGGIQNGNTVVSNIQLSGVGTFANSTFIGNGDGNIDTVESGDNRGYYEAKGTRGARFIDVYPELPIELQFGEITTDGTRNHDGSFKTQIDLTLFQTLAAPAISKEGKSYIRYINILAYMGKADINGDTITVNATPMVDSYCLKHLEITKVDNNSLKFSYFFDGANAYEGYGVATRNTPSGSLSVSRAVLSTASSITASVAATTILPANLQAVLSAMKPKDLSITPIAKIGSGAANLNITANRSAYSVYSGQYNGVVQLQFTNPCSPKVEQIEVVLLDPVGNQKVYDFKAPDSNPNYWGWGGQIQFPKADTQYILLIRKVVSNPVGFSLRAW